MIKILPIFILLFTFWFLVPGTNAQNAQDCPIGKNATGLISAPFISGFEGIGVCNKDPSSAFAPYKIPTYDDLKSLYYTQSKASKVPITSLSLPDKIADQTVYFAAEDLTTSNPSSGGTAVIFVEKNLNILQDITYGDANSGLVFVVRDNVYIKPSVTRINAVIISSGTIYTAGLAPVGCNHKSPIQLSPLVINGSLISLDDKKPIEFCRTLAINSEPAELINHQVKYLVILRNLLSDTLQRWSEIQ